MKTYKCGCFGEAMQFCSLHATAPDLLEAAKEALYLLKALTGDAELGTDCANGKTLLRNAIAKAEGGKSDETSRTKHLGILP